MPFTLAAFLRSPKQMTSCVAVRTARFWAMEYTGYALESGVRNQLNFMCPWMQLSVFFLSTFGRKKFAVALGGRYRRRRSLAAMPIAGELWSVSMGKINKSVCVCHVNARSLNAATRLFDLEL